MGFLLPRQEPSPSIPGPGGSQNGPAGVDPLDYCARRLAGLETGPIPNIGPASAAAIWSLVSFATVFIALRIYCKIWRSRGLWWDDLTMFLISATLCQRVITLGLGKYPCDIPPAHLPLIRLEGGGIAATFTIAAIVWSKTSFGLTILRLTRDTYVLRYFVLLVVVVMNTAMGLQAVFVWVRCSPVEKGWRPPGEVVGGRCWASGVSNGYAVFSAVLSGVCDLVFALLPWYLLWGLRMRRKEKAGVVVAMSMGVFAAATAFVKSTQIPKMGSKNFTREPRPFLFIGTTMMASCIPVLRVLFRDLRDSAPVEISGPSGRLYYSRDHKSNSTRETSQGVVNSPVDPALPVENTTFQQGSLVDQGANKAVSKAWGSCWDVGKRARRGSKQLPGTAAGADPAPPYVQARNSSQRALVHVSGESTPGEGTVRTQGVIVQTQEFEVKYEGRPRRDHGEEYELERIGVGETS
ncbi:hypothetical protein C8A01DRAFT_18899 [Parachaetomium inaequale]|uniref:Rhodopsin domain-containing protein n=1 Tax=Parachaetomium inaequale TaxID=2588326 RepID=A0AAN6PDB5_9PEZI|nr:hypothetical protein C8A01DRAFT_18899 [Parachaetomium inaequale]